MSFFEKKKKHNTINADLLVFKTCKEHGDLHNTSLTKNQ